MKRIPLVFNRLIIALALATQLFLLSPATQAVQNTNSSTSAGTMHDDHDIKRPTKRNRCRERCLTQYRQCTRGGTSPTQARCRQRYNQCLRSCRR